MSVNNSKNKFLFDKKTKVQTLRKLKHFLVVSDNLQNTGLLLIGLDINDVASVFAFGFLGNSH